MVIALLISASQAKLNFLPSRHYCSNSIPNAVLINMAVQKLPPSQDPGHSIGTRNIVTFVEKCRALCRSCGKRLVQNTSGHIKHLRHQLKPPNFGNAIGGGICL